MKIFFTIESYYPHAFGGGQAYVYRAAKELTGRGHQVAVIATRLCKADEHGLLERSEHDDTPVLLIGVSPSRVRPSERTTGMGADVSRTLVQLLQLERPDVVHVNGMKSLLTKICSELGIPFLATAHHMGIACPAGAMMRPDGSVCGHALDAGVCVRCCCTHKAPRFGVGAALGNLRPAVYRSLGRSLDRLNSPPAPARALMYPWLVEELIDAKQLLLRGAPLIIAPSKAIKDLLTLNSVPAERIVVLPHAVEALDTPPLRIVGGRPIRFGYVGRIDELKGLHIAIQALGALNLERGECELHIIGSPQHPWEDEYFRSHLSAYAGAPRIVKHGYVPPDALAGAYAALDVVIVPSLVPEAFGFVVLEAFAAGRPVIVFDSGALPEHVTPGVNGLVVRRGDVAGLAEAMQGLVDEPERITRMAANIPRLAGISEYVDRLEDLYRGVVMATDTDAEVHLEGALQ